ncbi:MAG: glycerol-3-phosphate 1-O-acyltransferase PlsY [Deltaproteobacteria bacterium]|nr:glycerol-3-phosphate 1-O-acyltransferase PlsY [Deltaproteobacteria bacterium]
MLILKCFALVIVAYMLGSIPFGLILTRLFTSIDIRKNGSRNIGATNVKRLAGVKLGIITLIGDVFKGAIPVYLGCIFLKCNAISSPLCLSMITLSAFLGHLYPVYMKFKGGGKGVATTAGCFFVLAPFALFVAMLVFVLFVCCFNRVSLASLASAAVLPLAVWKSTGSIVITGCSVSITILIYYRHWENIKRLFAGSEPVI